LSGKIASYQDALKSLMRFGDSQVSFGTSGVRISQLQKKTHKGVPAIFGLTLPAASANPNAGNKVNIPITRERRPGGVPGKIIPTQYSMHSAWHSRRRRAIVSAG
jgi:hypothetical protein